jgi:hypothetical protein
VIRLWLIRAALIALPFVAWFVWAKLTRKTGLKPPYATLFLLGIALAGASVVATVLLREDNRDEVYVPAEAAESGEVTPGRFEQLPPPEDARTIER